MKLTKIVLFCGVLVASFGCSEKEDAQTYIEQAKTYITQQDYAASLIALKNAIKLAPTQAEARFLAGKTHLSLGNGEEAVKSLKKALEFEYNTEKVVPLLSRAYMLTDADAEILELAPYVDLLSDDVKIHYLAYKTIAAIRLGELDLARAAEKEANALGLSSMYSHLSTAYIYLSDKKYNEAQGQLSKVLAADPNQPDAILLKAQTHTALNEYTQATEFYKKYAELQPNSQIIVLFLAESLLQEKKYNEAEKYADAIITNLPKQPFANYVKAVVKFEQKDYAKASEFAEVALGAEFKQAQLKLIAGASAFYQNNFEQTHHHLSAIIDYLPSEHPARKMYVVSLLQLGKIDDIHNSLSQTDLNKSEDVAFLSSLSFQLAELGATEDAKKLADQISENTDSTNAQDSAREGILKLMLSDPSGMKNLQEAINIDPNLVGAELALAYAAIQTGDYEKALEISRKWQAKYPDKPGSYNVLAAVYLKQGKLSLAKGALTKSIEIQPENMFALSELITLAARENKFSEAKEHVVKAVAYFPDSSRILKLNYQLFKDEDAFGKVKSFYQKDTNRMDAIILYGEVLMDRQQYLDALSILDEHKPTVETPKRWWQLNIIANKQLSNDIKINSLLEQWRSTNPYHIEPILLLVDLAVKEKDNSKAMTIIDKALRNSHPKNNLLRVTKMQLLLDRSLIEQAKKLSAELGTANLSPALLAGFEGRILLLEKKYKAAIPLLTQFYQEYPTAQNVLLLALAKQSSKQTADAIALLEQYVERKPNNTRVRGYLANLYLANEPQKAINSYQVMLKQQPDNIVVLNNLAWLSKESGDLTQAFEYAKKAYNLAPKVANIVDTYAQVLLGMNKDKEALVKQKEAFFLSKGKDSEIAINYAIVLKKNNKVAEAKKLLERIKPANQAQKDKIKQIAGK